MKQIIFNFFKKQYLSLLIIFLTSMLIWFSGPQIKIAHQVLLYTAAQRIFLITLLIAGWLLKYIFIDTASTHSATINPETEKKLKQLHGQFQGAIEFLKKTVIAKQEKNINLLFLPWYLLIGPSGAGKTTLLTHSNVNFILSKQFKSENSKIIAASDTCDWWITRDLVLIDIPGTYMSSHTKNSKLTYSVLWKQLLQLIKKFHPKKTLAGVIITLHLPEIIKQQRQQKNQIIYDLKKRINNLREMFGKDVPVHLLITKCDLLAGFLDFFGECSSDELSQAWGITLPSLNDNDNLIEVFSNRFNILIKRLNKQLIMRLHQERNPSARSYIKDFPLHIERLKQTISQFLKALSIPQLNLQSVHLCSATQENPQEETSYLSSTQNHFNTQALKIMSAPNLPRRTYFVRQFIMHLLTLSPATTNHQHHYSWQRRIVYAASAGIILTAALLLGRDFQHGVQRAYSIQHDLAEYQLKTQQLAQNQRLAKALTLLDALQQAAQHDAHSLSLAFYSKKSQLTANTVYHQALQTIIIPEITYYFENYLKTARDKNPEDVYAILQAYLMLGNKDYFQANYVANIMQRLIPDFGTEADMIALSHHIDLALHSTPASIQLNPELITQVRSQLTNLANLTLAFIILKNQDDNNNDISLNLGTSQTNPPIFSSKLVDSKVPALFTAKAFQKVMASELQTVATEVIEGNWVLGNDLHKTNQSVMELTEQLRAHYIANYVDNWENLLANIHLHSPENLAELELMVGVLTGNNSPLLQLIYTIKQNTAFAAISAASPKLQNLNMLLTSTHNQTSPLYDTFINLKQLAIYLKNNLSAPDGSNTIFAATAKRFQNPSHDPIATLHLIAEQSPEPMKTWLNTIATQTWHFMLDETSAQIQQAWQKEVMSFYQATIANRYPFNPAAHDEVNLQHFIAFMGQPGYLTNFIQTFLKPFVNDTTKKWQWRVLDNQQIPFSDTVLTQIEQATKLQHAFFPNGDNKLYVQFTLQPLDIDKNMKNFTLNINGQEIRYQKNSPRLFAWPGMNTLHATSVNFVDHTNQLQSNTIQGEWSWFRLVNQATDAIRTRKELSLKFAVNGHTANYLLFTEGHLNPFLPLNLSAFALPEQL